MILTVDNVEHVYVGARGACCCGCCGHHVYHSTNPTLNQSEVDNELFEMVIREINDSPDRIVEEGDFVSIETGDELKIAYLHRGEQ